jgi:hypothetical protein
MLIRHDKESKQVSGIRMSIIVKKRNPGRINAFASSKQLITELKPQELKAEFTLVLRRAVGSRNREEVIIKKGSRYQK